jgi:hypothetical protein
LQKRTPFEEHSRDAHFDAKNAAQNLLEVDDESSSENG